jgi:hypothetical protein
MDLNIRNVEKESVMELKGDALTLGLSLRELCIRKLGIKATAKGSEGEQNGTVQNDDGGRSGSGSEGKIGGSGDNASLPVLRPKKSAAKRLHPVQPMRGELAGRGEHRQEPDHRAEAEVHGVDLAQCRAQGHRILNFGGELKCVTCPVKGVPDGKEKA